MDAIGDRKTISIALLAAGSLLFETTLTRFLGVAQFYHFAFLVVSLALLGLGASGTILSVFPALAAVELERFLPWVGSAFAVSVGVAYAGINWIPFDSYSIAWNRIQLLYFTLYYAVLSLPFIISGLGVGTALSQGGEGHHQVYGANLVGSAVGAILAPVFQGLSGVPGAVTVSALLGWGVFLLYIGGRKGSPGRPLLSVGLTVVGCGVFFGLTARNLRGSSPLGLTLSPYKGLSQARRYPGSRARFGAWNAISRVDVISDAGTRALPGLSYQYQETPPPQIGLSVDAGPLQPITLVEPAAFQAAKWMPEGLAFSLFPHAEVLVVHPGGGLGVLQALAGEAEEVTAVVENPLLLRAIAETAGATDVYQHRRVQVVTGNDRAYIRHSERSFDLLYYPLTDAYRPVTSGAFSLAENYTLTVGGFRAALRRIKPGGMLVISRWLQSPPSEGIRLVATLLEAAERKGMKSPGEKMVIYRGVQTITVLMQPGRWDEDELNEVRSFLESRRYDLVWAPDIRASEVNRFNKLPEAHYYREIRALLRTRDRSAYYSAYPFDISPPDDHHPFFFHYFTWEQTPEVLATLGRTWQPFGGSGYFILLALLALVILLSLILILLPLLTSPDLVRQLGRIPGPAILLYFGFLGLGFMFIEIPLIQRWILFLGQPIYAFAAVVGTILFFSGLGSLSARRPWDIGKTGWALVISIALGLPILSSIFADMVLGWPLWGRLAAAILSLGPVGFLMGFPFPLGLSWVKSRVPGIAPWAWGVNGFCSVIASVIASILALSYGYQAVFLAGLGSYLGAGFAFWSLRD